jgi:hypothetical protein
VENVPPKKVRFLVTDLVHPHPAQVLMELFQDLQLEGEVAVGTTDGEAPYLIVRVAGLSEPVIVPLDRTRCAVPAAHVSSCR